jgi:hypothetical protein
MLLGCGKSQEGVRTKGRINADQLIDSNESIVRYTLTSKTGEDIFFDVDLDSTHTKLEKTRMYLSKSIEDGERSLHIPAEEGMDIILTFLYKRNEIFNMKVDVDYRPERLGQDTPDDFTVLSKDGFPIIFRFHWYGKGDNIWNVSVFPKNNPFVG